MISLKRLLFATLFFASTAISIARLTDAWTYQEMFDRSDLVVIAELMSSRDTDERNVLKDIEPPVEVVGVTTECTAQLILKGTRDIRNFRLHHYRFFNSSQKLDADAPELIEVSRPHQMFLLFLVKEKDGRYVPVSGQTDPGIFSVIELKGAASLNGDRSGKN